MQNDAYDFVLRGGLVVGYLVFCRLYPGSAAAAFCAPRGLEPTAIDVAAPRYTPRVRVYVLQFPLLPWVQVFALFPTCVPRPETRQV